MNDFDTGMDLFEFAEMALQQAASAEAVTETPEVETVPAEKKLSRADFEQAALAFIVSLKPDAVARNVPTRNSKFRATAAGFWKHARSKGAIVTRTALVMVYDDINCCFSDCENREARVNRINAMQQQKSLMEADIRKKEPHLAAADDLFSEFRTWDYSASTNSEYHRLCRIIEKELQILSKGSKLERIRQAGVADQCYLAIPDTEIVPELIPANWGIVGLNNSMSRFKLIREAEIQDNVTPEQRAGFALNIGTAAANAVCFAGGVDKDASLRKPPRRRGRINCGK